MLKKIICDKFKMQPKTFRKGLNVVLGSSDGSNAIGKSTFLMILDFVFGGDDYVKSAKDIVAHIDHHTIKFEFEFDGVPHFFARSTNHPSVVNGFDSAFHIAMDEITIHKYREWLLNKYKIRLPNINFGDIVERFFRIYGHGNHNEHKPLQVERETMVTAVENLMKLLNKYEDIYNLKTAEDSYGFKQSRQADRLITDIMAEISENKDKIAAMEARRDKLSKQNEEANLRVLGIDHEKIERLVNIRKELGRLYSRKRRLKSQFDAVRNNMPDNDGVLKKDFSALLRFFPNANINAFTDVEQFHEKINRFLRADISEEIARLTPLIEVTNADISTIEKQLADSGIARSISQSILTQYARIFREIDQLAEKNKELKSEIDQILRRKDTEQLLASLRRKQEIALADAEKEVNAKLVQINSAVTGGNRPAPELILKPDKTFGFGTSDDKSEGTAFKNLVVYDLSMLEMTPLPVLIHDSSIVKRIEDADFEQILGLYIKSGRKGKQVFIAFDKADSYTPKTFKILERAAILHLSVGNELYGTSWSRITE